MQIKTHLRIFDFDDTLFRIVNYTCSQAKGYEPDHWFDSPISLDTEIFNIRGIGNVIEDALDPTSANYMVTQRVEECREAVLNLINSHGIRLDGAFFLGRKSKKSDTLKSLIGPNTKRITIYEDSLFEVYQYVQYFQMNPTNIRVDICFVDKNKLFRYTLEEAKAFTNVSSIDRLRIL